MDYKLIDSGNGRRLEKFGKYILNRPDPDCLWNTNLESSEWEKADAVYLKTVKDKGYWQKDSNFPEKWAMKHNMISFYLKLTPFKHTGCFPEQAWQWDFIESKVDKAFKFLNLFGYTGIASLFALSKKAEVTHVDASKPSITWFKENQALSGLNNEKARVILDDSLKFAAREVKRGNKYDGIILDPPSFGHGPNGETWNFREHTQLLLKEVSKLLSDKAKFVIVNAYAVSTSHLTLANMLDDYIAKNHGGKVRSGEIVIEEESGSHKLSTGIYAIWEK